MQRVLQILGSLVLAVALISCESETSLPMEPAPLNPIVNGTPTHYESWRGVVMVETVYVRCSGSLVHPQVVLTAAHCIRRSADGASLGYDLSDRPDQIRVAVFPDLPAVRCSPVERILAHKADTEAGETLAPRLPDPQAYGSRHRRRR